MATVLSHPGPVRAHCPAAEAGLALGATALDLVYVPVKSVVAVGGMVLGSVTGLLTGGDTRAAYALWVPTGGGTFILTPSHLDGTRPVEFFGTDYADEPSRSVPDPEGSTMLYDWLYMPPK